MKFLIDNVLLIVIALVSGGMLFMPMINRRNGGPMLDTLAATRLINDNNALIIDVRSNSEFADGHMPAAKNIPLEDVEKRAGEIPAGKPVILVCATGMRSGKASGVLRKGGRAEVYNLDGGLGAWRQAGLPVIK